jgi:hypothetical protein
VSIFRRLFFFGAVVLLVSAVSGCVVRPLGWGIIMAVMAIAATAVLSHPGTITYRVTEASSGATGVIELIAHIIGTQFATMQVIKTRPDEHCSAHSHSPHRYQEMHRLWSLRGCLPASPAQPCPE